MPVLTWPWLYGPLDPWVSAWPDLRFRRETSQWKRRRGWGHGGKLTIVDGGGRSTQEKWSAAVHFGNCPWRGKGAVHSECKYVCMYVCNYTFLNEGPSGYWLVMYVCMYVYTVSTYKYEGIIYACMYVCTMWLPSVTGECASTAPIEQPSRSSRPAPLYGLIYMLYTHTLHTYIHTSSL